MDEVIEALRAVRDDCLRIARDTDTVDEAARRAIIELAHNVKTLAWHIEQLAKGRCKK